MRNFPLPADEAENNSSYKKRDPDWIWTRLDKARNEVTGYAAQIETCVTFNNERRSLLQISWSKILLFEMCGCQFLRGGDTYVIKQPPINNLFW